MGESNHRPDPRWLGSMDRCRNHGLAKIKRIASSLEEMKGGILRLSGAMQTGRMGWTPCSVKETRSLGAFTILSLLIAR
jgi:hypothetical protein